MMRKIVIFLLIISTAAIAQDETGFKFSVGPELGFAAGSFSNTHSVGTGATLQAEYHMFEKMNLTGTVGVLFYAGKSQGNNLKNNPQTIIPLRGGIKYFVSGGAYIGAQAGVAPGVMVDDRNPSGGPDVLNENRGIIGRVHQIVEPDDALGTLAGQRQGSLAVVRGGGGQHGGDRNHAVGDVEV